jgi:hypothetical protein
LLGAERRSNAGLLGDFTFVSEIECPLPTVRCKTPSGTSDYGLRTTDN